jgi:ubiquinone/menaquinone biosynthesis C-methylase UbiE
MHLKKTRWNWEKLAELDALWAVLTRGEKPGRAWDETEFFRTGEDNVRSHLEWAATLGKVDTQGEALDFGCGVGRLTQALAKHFRSVVGVDIAKNMLVLARRYNRFGDTVTYLHNTEPHLRRFEDNRFALVYSLITLQHMAPRYAKVYLAEFVRIASAGGLILFQVPSTEIPGQQATRQPMQRRPFTLWPDTLLRRAIRDIRQSFKPSEPKMEMYAIHPSEVSQIMRDHGAEILATRRVDHAGPEIESVLYLAQKKCR